jgi:hypothetical protein
LNARRSTLIALL